MNTIRENYLKKLANDFDEMSRILLEQIDLVKNVLNDKSPVSAPQREEINQREQKLDQIEMRFRKEIATDIMQYAPKAGDLRRVVALMNMIIDMERAGDLLKNITKFSDIIIGAEAEYGEFRTELNTMYEKAAKMLQLAIGAYITEKSDIAKFVIDADDEVDNLNVLIYRKILDLKYVEQRDIPLFLAFNKIANTIERIGDSATNIAESIIYFVDGLDLKHVD